jgi:1-deoxy-D-xylulose-5-phosphate reductoisomerase
MQPKRVVVLGATGSIGQSAIKVARDIPERMEIVGLAAKSNARTLAAQANVVRPEAVCLVDESRIAELRAALDYEPVVFAGETGLQEIACLTNAEMVLVAVVGTGGLRPALAALEAGKDLAVASKEILVMAGEIVMREASRKGVHVLPVDSEHNAIFQCLDCGASFQLANAGERQLTKLPHAIRRIILTASGGPFRETPNEEFASITPEQALKHPTWNMGPKITVDSATLANKGLELIEAHFLFGLPYDQIEVVVHPTSVVHALVRLRDGATLAHLGYPDMRVPISYALTYPERSATPIPPLDLAGGMTLEFEPPDLETFPLLAHARTAGEQGGTYPCAFNAANEVAVAAFLEGRLPFLGIAAAVADALAAADGAAARDLDDLVAADEASRRHVEEALKVA